MANSPRASSRSMASSPQLLWCGLLGCSSVQNRNQQILLPFRGLARSMTYPVKTMKLSRQGRSTSLSVWRQVCAVYMQALSASVHNSMLDMQHGYSCHTTILMPPPSTKRFTALDSPCMSQQFTVHSHHSARSHETRCTGLLNVSACYSTAPPQSNFLIQTLCAAESERGWGNLPVWGQLLRDGQVPRPRHCCWAEELHKQPQGDRCIMLCSGLTPLSLPFPIAPLPPPTGPIFPSSPSPQHQHPVLSRHFAAAASTAGSQLMLLA